MRPISDERDALGAALRDRRPRRRRCRAWRRRPAAARRRCRRISRAQVARRLIDRLAADRRRARAIGAAAVGHGVGVAGDHAHALHGHAQRRGGDLAHDGVGALALLGDADRADDAAVGLELDDAGVLQRDRRAADAVVARAGPATCP